MNAEALIDYIFEGVPGDLVFAYVPGMTDAYGVGAVPRKGEDPFTTWTKQFLKEAHKQIPPDYIAIAKRSPEDFIDLLLGQHGAMVITLLNGNADVYSANRTAKNVPEEFLSKVGRFMDIQPDMTVGWFKSVNADPVRMLAAEVIFGEEAGAGAGAGQRHKTLGMHAQADLRRKFWSKAGYDPETAPDIVDKLLQ